MREKTERAKSMQREKTNSCAGHTQNTNRNETTIRKNLTTTHNSRKI
jgi:hypothetical protein